MKTDQNVHSIVEGILKYLEEKGSLDLLPQVAKALTKQSWVKVDPNLAIVFSKIKLDSTQLQNIKQSLSVYLDRPIRLKSRIDKSIIAGIKIEIAGQVLDATVNRKLKELKTKVTYDWYLKIY